jgi:hypothetical protein
LQLSAKLKLTQNIRTISSKLPDISLKSSGHFTQNIRTIHPKLPDILLKTSGHFGSNSLTFSPQSYVQISTIITTNLFIRTYKSPQS